MCCFYSIMRLLLLPLVAVALTSCGSFNSPGASPSYSPESTERQIQRSGSMGLKSRSLKVSSAKTVAIATKYRALITSSSLRKDDYRATLRVPSPSLPSLMESLETVGKVTYKNVEMTDVTEAYLDLQAELKNKRALRDRLRALLSKATKVEDILKIEKELSRVQTDLDRMEARMKSVSSKVSHSTLNLSIERERIPGPIGVVTKSTGWLFGKLKHLN